MPAQVLMVSLVVHHLLKHCYQMDQEKVGQVKLVPSASENPELRNAHCWFFCAAE